MRKYGLSTAGSISEYTTFQPSSAATPGGGRGGGYGGGQFDTNGRYFELPWRPSPACSQEQRAVLERVQQGGNVFFTGSAGVGKSFLLKEIVRLLESKRINFRVTATTGIAALNIGGSTVHSWASVGLAAEEVVKLWGKIVSK